MTTIQGPQHRAATQGPPRRYPLPLQMGYKATSKLGPLYGFGQIRVISSKDIIFGPGDGLQPGMNAEIVVAWPRLLDGRVRLQLVLDAIITGSQDGVTEAHILTYDFRTAGLVSSKENWMMAGNSSELLGWRGDSPRILHHRPLAPGV